MAISVVDASALSAVLFGEPAAAEVVEQLRGSTLAAPTLLIYELGNTCWKKCRRHPASAPALREALGSLPELELQLLDVEPIQVLKLAEARELTFYDAAYLWLADRLHARLVTLDRRLAHSFEGAGPA
jgi:predicted nucleic acid-binding protein